jgi:hypothetical protein
MLGHFAFRVTDPPGRFRSHPDPLLDSWGSSKTQACGQTSRSPTSRLLWFQSYPDWVYERPPLVRIRGPRAKAEANLAKCANCLHEYMTELSRTLHSLGFQDRAQGHLKDRPTFWLLCYSRTRICMRLSVAASPRGRSKSTAIPRNPPNRCPPRYF